MNPFVVQNLSSTEGFQFHNKPLVLYPQLVQNSYISSVGRSDMLRYPNHTVGSYNILPQNSILLPENYQQFGPTGRQLFNYVGVSHGSNLSGQSFTYPVNVFNEKMKGLAEFPSQTNSITPKIGLARNMQPASPQAESLVKNFTKSPYVSDTNRARLLDAFNQNFNLSRPTALDVQDRKRKKVASDERVVLQSSNSYLSEKGNKRNKSTCEVCNEPKKYVNNPNAMKKDAGQAKSRIVIEEDENGLLRVCSEPLMENNNIRKGRIGIKGESNTKGSSVDNDSKLADLDLTLRL